MENSIVVMINGKTVVDMEDADKAAVVAVLDCVTKTVDKFGLRDSTIKALEKSPTLRKAMFVAAQAGDAHLSTVLG